MPPRTCRPSQPNRSTRALALAWALFSAGCDEPKPAPEAGTLGRSQVILATDGAKPTPAAASSPTAPGSVAGPRKGPLCDARPGTEFPKGALATLDSAGVPGQSAPLRGLTWVNLWAAWCEPCKREIPTIIDFQKRLKGSGLGVSLAFVSLDDDKRQLEQFLAKNAASGFGQTLWLGEGEKREEWLKALGSPTEPRLPVHYFVDGSKKVFCRVEGSIQAEDFAAIETEFRNAG